MATPPPAAERDRGRRVVVTGAAAAERDTLTRTIAQLGHDAAGAAPGDDLWSALAGDPPDVVVLDGGAAPAEAAAALRSMLPAEVPVLVIVDAGAEAAIEAALRSGADDFAVRPVAPEALAMRLEVMGRVARLQDALRHSQARLHAMATTDELTGLPNPRTFRRRLRDALAHMRRFGIPVACALVVCDDHDAIVAQHGHAVGNHVVRELGRLLVANLRDTDLLCREGGGRFVLGLVGAQAEGARVVADRLRQLARIALFRLGDAEVMVTLSVGVAVAGAGARTDAEALRGAAEDALDRARATGPDGLFVLEAEGGEA
ncbi:MAG: diguanylate cyclase [Myxococcales bacterium]|nr:diguanylate cyclase [Myxococcales bacterium]